MSFSTTLTKLLKDRTDEQLTAAERYRDLVSQAAGDGNVTPATIETVLSAAGKSLDDLAGDVAAERERRRNLSVVARRDELLSELGELNAEERGELEQFNQAFRKLQEDHVSAVKLFQSRRASINGEIERCRLAERKLTAGHPRLAEIRSELAALAQQENQLRMMSGRPKTPAEQLHTRVDALNQAFAAGRLDRQGLERAAAKLPDSCEITLIDKRLGDLDARREELTHEQNRIEAELLTLSN
ncbi:MAG: hypothetical protein ACYC0X_05975 [Pirellulaceae bacterium]